MAKNKIPTPDEPIEECPPCPQVAPLYLGTFSDMAILLMAFFVILISIAIVTPEKYRILEESMASTFGVQREVPLFQEATAENVIMEQFRSAQVDPQVFDIIQEERTDEPQPESEPDVAQGRSTEATNALEILEQRLSKEIAEGKVETRIENNRVVVELIDIGAGEGDSEDGAMNQGRLDRDLLEVFLQVAAAQSQTSGVIEVLDGTQAVTTATVARQEVDTVAETYREVLISLADETRAGLIEVRREEETVVITIAGDESFSSGSALFRPNFVELLNQIGDTLLPLAGITRIEGHTDSSPLAFGGRYSDNWDLSSARAAAVTEFFLDELYLRPGDIYMSAFADTAPVASNETAAGRARNRRMEVVFTPN